MKSRLGSRPGVPVFCSFFSELTPVDPGVFLLNSRRGAPFFLLKSREWSRFVVLFLLLLCFVLNLRLRALFCFLNAGVMPVSVCFDLAPGGPGASFRWNSRHRSPRARISRKQTEPPAVSSTNTRTPRRDFKVCEQKKHRSPNHMRAVGPICVAT